MNTSSTSSTTTPFVPTRNLSTDAWVKTPFNNPAAASYYRPGDQGVVTPYGDSYRPTNRGVAPSNLSGASRQAGSSAIHSVCGIAAVAGSMAHAIDPGADYRTLERVMEGKAIERGLRSEFFRYLQVSP